MNDSNLNIYREFVAGLTKSDFIFLERAVKEQRSRLDFGFGTIDEAIAVFCPDAICPVCKSKDCTKYGKTSAGRQRYKCSICKTVFCPTASTILDYGKKDFPIWVEFLQLMIANAPLEVVAHICHISTKTAFEWRHRIFVASDAYQEKLVLKNKIWITEVTLTEEGLAFGFGSFKGHGISSEGINITFLFDDNDNMIALIHEDAILKDEEIERIAPYLVSDSTIICHGKWPYRNIADMAGCQMQAHSVDDKDEFYPDVAKRLGRLSKELRQFLDRFSDMKEENLQSYLNWFCFLYPHRHSDSAIDLSQIIQKLITQDAHYRRPYTSE